MMINLMEPVYEWLLTGPAWVEYRTRVDLLGQHETAPEVVDSRRRMLADPLVSGLITELAGWPGHVLNSHKSASQQFHKLNFLVDIGITAADEGMQLVVDKILAHQSEEGPFQLPTQISEHFGGSGEETGAWALCDAPLILYALSKLGYREDTRVRKGIEYLIPLCRENGWPCTVSRELGKFRGPGRKDDPCSYATPGHAEVVKFRFARQDFHRGKIWCRDFIKSLGTPTGAAPIHVLYGYRFFQTESAAGLV